MIGTEGTPDLSQETTSFNSADIASVDTALTNYSVFNFMDNPRGMKSFKPLAVFDLNKPYDFEEAKANIDKLDSILPALAIKRIQSMEDYYSLQRQSFWKRLFTTNKPSWRPFP